MEYRLLGRSGLEVPQLSFGTGTFKGEGEYFAAWGGSGVGEARRLVDICLDGGLNLFDSADTYSDGGAEEVLGAAIKGRRDRVLIATKTGQSSGDGPNEAGASRERLIRACEGSLRRLGTDYVDILYLHSYDGSTPIEETMSTLSELVRQGKVRYIGASNFAGWQMMKAQAFADRHGHPKFIAHQAYYSLIGRDYEWELMPFGIDQGVGAHVWSPLGWARLTGKVRRDAPLPQTSRLHKTGDSMPFTDHERLFRVVDVIDEIALETGKTVPQIAINWVLMRPTVSSVIIGARNEEQLRQNLGSVGWSLSAEQIARLEAASAVHPPYPYWTYYRTPAMHRRSPPPVASGLPKDEWLA